MWYPSLLKIAEAVLIYMAVAKFCFCKNNKRLIDIDKSRTVLFRHVS